MAEAPDSGDEGQPRPLPAHVTLPLLSLITAQSIDQDYQHAAARRAQESVPDDAERRRTRVLTAVVVAVFGVLVSIAGVQTSRDADVDALGRASLVARIQEGKAEVRGLQDRAGELRDLNAEADDTLRVLRERESELSQQVSRLGVRTGYLAVRGPGLRITVDSAPDAVDNDVLKDSDLQFLVDGLWAAGAEAVAVNGQRLTVLSAIANSGKTIHVNVRPLTPPYVVTAIGNPDTLESRLLQTTHGAVFYAVARSLEFRFEISDDDSIEMPAARVRPLLHASEGLSGRPGENEETQP